MTGRQLIAEICNGMTNLDAAVKIRIYHRDSHNGVIGVENTDKMIFIADKIRIERSDLSTRRPL